MRLILFFNITLLLFSCNLSKKREREPDPFKELTTVEESIDENTINGSMILFCKSNNPNEIGYSNIYNIIRSYLNDPKYNQEEYKMFITNLIDFKSTFSCDDIVHCLNINDTIKENYNKNNFSDFLLKYSNDTINKDEYTISNKLSFNSQLSVIYYLYLNNYYTIFDDLSGFYYSRKIENFSDKLINLNLEDWK